jgi:threonine/homoserine/homoserine lactone efflux protein
VPTQETLLAFALVSAGIMLIPGPSNLFLLAHGIGHGRRSALAAAGGVEVASALRVLLTAAGLSALLASSAVAFGIVRWAGVAYLVYLGVHAFRSGPPVQQAHADRASVPLMRCSG